MTMLTIESWPPVDGVVKIHKGATFDPTMTWRDANGPIDWTGYSGAMSLVFDVDNTIVLSTANGGMTMGSDGVIAFLLSDTSEVPEQLGYFNIAAVSPDVKTRILSKGRVEVD